LVAASETAARALFGPDWRDDDRGALLHCGIDISQFKADIDRLKIRSSWGIDPNDFVVGHVGGFKAPKNHGFILEVFVELVRRQPDSRLLLVGDGEYRHDFVKLARLAGVDDRVILTGARGDVVNLLAMMDVFVFPSVWEGLPLGLLEAQAMCLPCVISDVISTEVDIVPELISRLSLLRSSAHWAERTLAMAARPRPKHREILQRIKKSTFEIGNSLDSIYALYGA
jgi:glycosyltransferase involved in cell wall biosynthesis